MKKDLYIAAALIGVAALGIGAVMAIPFFYAGEDATKAIPSKPEPIAPIPKPEPAKSEAKVEPARVVEVKTPQQPKIQKKQPNPEPKKQPEILPPPKKEVAKVEPKKEAKSPVDGKVIVLGELIRLADPDGEYVVRALKNDKAILLGKIKTLKVPLVDMRSTLDTLGLDAEEIVFLGAVNRGSAVRIGKVKTLKIHSVDGGSAFDASKYPAEAITVAGNLNGGSRVGLSAPGGSVILNGEINGGARVDIAAAGGTVRIKSSHATILNGESMLVIAAQNVELLGAIDGTRTEAVVTLGKAGTLKFARVRGTARLHYRKSGRSDPAIRIDVGPVAARAQFRELPAQK